MGIKGKWEGGNYPPPDTHKKYHWKHVINQNDIFSLQKPFEHPTLWKKPNLSGGKKNSLSKYIYFPFYSVHFFGNFLWTLGPKCKYGGNMWVFIAAKCFYKKPNNRGSINIFIPEPENRPKKTGRSHRTGIQ